MEVVATAPANIALIKYMGKIDAVENVPTNGSLSLTLDHLITKVQISFDDSQVLAEDEWQPLVAEGFQAPVLSESGKARYLKHFQWLKQRWGITKNFHIESANNFPSDCGLASSASSFAALTKAAVLMFQNLAPKEDIGLHEIAELSRHGSGSSCRSFYGPFSLWHKEGVRPLEFPFGSVLHQVLIVESKPKEVPSSQAHKRVPSSPLFVNRVARADARMAQLTVALLQERWDSAYQICWDEFIDMHALFETSVPPFTYMETASKDCLAALKSIWDIEKDGPIVTMDAGANIHLLWRQDQKARAEKLKADSSPRLRVLSSWDPVAP